MTDLEILEQTAARLNTMPQSEFRQGMVAGLRMAVKMLDEWRAEEEADAPRG